MLDADKIQHTVHLFLDEGFLPCVSLLKQEVGQLLERECLSCHGIDEEGERSEGRGPGSQASLRSAEEATFLFVVCMAAVEFLR